VYYFTALFVKNIFHAILLVFQHPYIFVHNYTNIFTKIFIEFEKNTNIRIVILFHCLQQMSIMTKEQHSKVELFDTHAHLNLNDACQSNHSWCNSDGFLCHFPVGINFRDDFPELLDLQIAGVVLPGTTTESSRWTIQQAEKSDLLFAGVGIHPNSTGEAKSDDWSVIVELSKNPCVAAIGETGLDRYWDTVPFEIQLQYFERHLDLAKERGLPILVHSRDCDDDMLAVLGDRAKVSPIFGVIHSFSSTTAVAERYLEMGLYISFSGAVTYTNKKFSLLREAAKKVPDDRLLIETDCPYLIPHPYRGKLDENVPIMTAYVAKTLALLRGTTIEHIAAITTANARKIFRKK
jgi:TatD DNase family protein